jgi:hypothetical protein
MAFHQFLQRLLLVGIRMDAPPSPPLPPAPARLQPLIHALAATHRNFDDLAIRHGHRYRNGFWSLYLLSALAVLCAMMPLALGWDSTASTHHAWAAAWVIAEVGVIAAIGVTYWRGHSSDWQGAWLRARTIAELTSYLPMLAPLVDVEEEPATADWYQRTLGREQQAGGAVEIGSLCQQHEAWARRELHDAWKDNAFVAEYAAWATGILRSQRAYHRRVAQRAHALQHRVHRITAALFGLTALGALAHLVIHSRWLSLVTTVFPALAAALHGALAQSEAYRLHAASERFALALQQAITAIESAASGPVSPARIEALRLATRDAIALILEEHQDWYMLVKPHHLPLG